jgi:hypothetical protein
MRAITIARVLVGLSLFLVGCGLGVYYPNLDWLIPWYVNGYISLEPAQSGLLKTKIARQLDWHCQTQLPAYADFLRGFRREIDDDTLPVTVERLDAYTSRLKGYWEGMVMRATPELADVLFLATDEQVGELFENLEQKNREIEKEFVAPSPQKIIQNRHERMLERLDFWFVDLTKPQRQAVAEWSRQIEPIAADRVAYRRLLQREGRRLFENRASRDVFKAEFVALLATFENSMSDDYQRKIAVNTKRTLQLVVYLLETRTPKQRDHLSKRLETLAADFERLSCDPAVRKSRAEADVLG